jgi:aspartate aminotransferase
MAISTRISAAAAAFSAVKHFYFESRYGQRRLAPGISDFTFGNPHEMPLEGLVSAIRARAVPHDQNWFAYKTSEEDPQAFLAEHAGRELGLAFDPADIALTAGAFGAIMVAFHLVLDVGDEAIYSEPAWFCYEPTLLAVDAVPRQVALKAPAFDLDLGAIDAAIGPRTRLVIVNTPHNPTGRIYGRETLRALAELLERASVRIGHRLYLLSDEPYRRLRFDGRGFASPAGLYPWTLISYSYGKVLLAPGQRLGYLALSPLMPQADRQALRDGPRLVFSQRRDAVRSAGPGRAVDRPRGARTAARPPDGRPARGWVRGPVAGRDVLHLEQVARRRPRAALERACRPGRLRVARRHHEGAWPLPDQPDRVR